MLRGLASDKRLKRTRLRKWLQQRLGDDKRIPLTTKLKKYVRKWEKKYMQRNTDNTCDYTRQTRFIGKIFVPYYKQNCEKREQEEMGIVQPTETSCLVFPPSLPNSIKCQRYPTFDNTSWKEYQKRFSKYWRVRVNIYLTRS